MVKESRTGERIPRNHTLTATTKQVKDHGLNAPASSPYLWMELQ